MTLLRESLILHKLKHPAIVKFIGINLHSFDNPDKLEPTIITEYVSHGSLKEILKKEQNSIADSKWTPTKKYICLLGIADAMRYLHQHGIVHRDLKPENVLVDENYYPRVCDFGLSRCFSFILSKSVQLSMTGKIGTPLYMAPELMMDEDKYGPGIDVYSFAILAYEIVSGKEPFSTRGKPIKLVDLGNKVMSGGRPEFTEGVTEKMKDLITQCWSQDYKDRPSFDEIFKKLSTDFSYLDEDVEEDEIQEYLETLKEETELIPPLPTIEEMQQIRNKNEELESLLKKITDENAQLKKVNRKVSHDIKNLTTENTQLKKDNEKISNDNEKLTKENTQLKKDNEKISNDNEKLKGKQTIKER
ncbi:hypothetical protein M9Y10_007275 [Tritrichomonas musculus]|uniref:Protein kinase domain-containing protein n=1 Tax=Tritrichomonas musculus TaxID=1915356 RepID=A0ABR2J0V7_9EUKA